MKVDFDVGLGINPEDGFDILRNPESPLVLISDVLRESSPTLRNTILNDKLDGSSLFFFRNLGIPFPLKLGPHYVGSVSITDFQSGFGFDVRSHLRVLDCEVDEHYNGGGNNSQKSLRTFSNLLGYLSNRNVPYAMAAIIPVPNDESIFLIQAYNPRTKVIEGHKRIHEFYPDRI
jgi:hypothetical protein|tara:strand:+ start:3684 stop:4208 length:525 start_codon:yes stop_codon:yes gene_type:complete